jgi:hypothetical protein
MTQEEIVTVRIIFILGLNILTVEAYGSWLVAAVA